jgi:alkylhydroperoxidase family enzyme
MTDAVLDDWRTAPIDDKLRAMLGFLEKMSLHPDELTAEDADAVRAAGVSEQAMTDAVHAAAAFNIIDRVADAVDFHVVSRASFRRVGKVLLKRGYA